MHVLHPYALDVTQKLRLAYTVPLISLHTPVEMAGFHDNTTNNFTNISTFNINCNLHNATVQTNRIVLRVVKKKINN